MAGALLESLLERAGPEPDAPAWLADTRRAAADALAREGLPGARDEAWKYTSLRALGESRPASGDAAAAGRAVDPSLFALPLDGPRLVFVNGVHRSDLSTSGAIAGVSVSSLGSASATELESWRALLVREYDGAASAFARLNTALAVDGPLIRIAASCRIDVPVHLVFIGAGRDIAWHARALIELGERSSLRVVVHHVGVDAAAQLGNVVVQASLRTGARLDLVEIQDAANDATLMRRSELMLADEALATSHVLEVGARLSRHDLAVDLCGRASRFVSRGVFALRGRQHADTHLDIRHDARDTASHVVWRGVADERSRGVFHGAITVAQGADGADANLSNKNLLLSPGAEIDTQPVLEIHADEVKAAHGATVGQLDGEALFYLRSRGLPPEAARHLLIVAFCAAAFAGVAEDLRVQLEGILAAHLPLAGETS
ncbi:MAG TPA: Fe-S cluster assembly protein SufD [Rhodanobacteraceae bacterium]|nr:Fe-S cluster assembly protein SufD [Rhodanobacteraceae bacterium]